MQLEIRIKGDRFKPEDNLLLSEAFQMVSTHRREPVELVIENGQRVVRAAVDMENFENEFASLPPEKRGSYVRLYIYVPQRGCY
jgi:hypothetical protein